MKFKYGDTVVVKEGFLRGCKGKIVKSYDKFPDGSVTYGVDLKRDYDDIEWFGEGNLEIVSNSKKETAQVS